MATSVSTRPIAKNYLGNKNHYEVHHLPSETTSCQINEIIRAGHAVVFNPDTKAQAHAEGYDNCAYCIGASTR